MPSFVGLHDPGKLGSREVGSLQWVKSYTAQGKYLQIKMAMVLSGTIHWEG